MRTVLYGSNRIHGLAGLLIAAATVRLQAQQAAAPSPWKQGMPAAAASSTLAPVAPPPVASGLHRPNGIALHKGTLYIAELSQISKIDNIEDNLDNPPKPTVILADLPKDEPHGWKYLTVGPDEKLYFQVGVPCNICLPSDRHGRIYRVGLDGKDLEVYAYGIRQIVGMDWHPTLKQLYFSENARDRLSEDIPEDKLNRVTQPGKDHFGYPYCHQGNFTDPEREDRR